MDGWFNWETLLSHENQRNSMWFRVHQLEAEYRSMVASLKELK